jgi:beta-ribofuranosylaminobenzene 5'-phosphate synthase
MPLVIHKGRLPDWKIGICVPVYISSKSEQEEVDFFDTQCPIDRDSVKTILYEAVYGITSSIIERDYEVFCKSVNTIQATKWKYLERTQYGDDLIELERKIRFLGADCVGMSSFGPMLFFTGGDINNIIKEISSNISDTICYDVSFNNQGRIINYD